MERRLLVLPVLAIGGLLQGGCDASDVREPAPADAVITPMDRAAATLPEYTRTGFAS